MRFVLKAFKVKLIYRSYEFYSAVHIGVNGLVHLFHQHVKVIMNLHEPDW
ncbi:MAG: hypothetical protein M3Q56_06145 [Bacteroidota bacterium]|nr:hypothetical protein [Bacteroidota bacterium]